MITKLSSQQKNFNTQLFSLLSWESVSNKDVVKTVEEIINTIRSKGDESTYRLLQLNLMVLRQSQWLTL